VQGVFDQSCKDDDDEDDEGDDDVDVMAVKALVLTHQHLV